MGLIRIGAALSVCRKSKFSITRTGLLGIGSSYGFVSKEGRHWYFDEGRLQVYIKGVFKKLPSGYCSIKQIALLCKKSIHTIYRFIRENDIEVKKVGRKHVLYVNKERFMACFNNRKKERKENLNC